MKTITGFLLAVVGLTAVLAASPAIAVAQEKPGPPVWMESEQTCLKCHQDPQARSILSTAHGVKGDSRTPMAQHTCETCHGPSPEHNNATVPKGQTRPPVQTVFKGPFISPVSERNKVCAACHSGGNHIYWPGSAHNANDVACTDCHTAHSISDPVLRKRTEPQVCFTCHAQQRAESLQFSHHPIQEGKVTCSDCHNTHGSPAPKQLKEVTLNETCYTCHAEKRGPFLWEHEPVRENCATCHLPHGATQAGLLKLRQPFLCQTCHQSSRNGHEGLVSGANQLPGGKGSATPTYNMLLAMGCANCHSQVHGSNAPSGGMLTH